MLLPEPTSSVVWNANRGAITLRVRVLGKPAHVGLQHQGANAFERMHQVVGRLQELKREVERRTTRCAVGAEQRRNSILMLGGQSGGGTNFNVVPEECWFTVDRRINPEENLAEEKARLLGALEECKQAGIPLEWEILQEGRSASCGSGEVLGGALSRSVQAVTGQTACFEMCPGLLETRFYAEAGVPAYAYGSRIAFGGARTKRIRRPPKVDRLRSDLCPDGNRSVEHLNFETALSHTPELFIV